MNIESVDLNLFVVFDALMTERSVTRAAAKVGLSQPALSNALARLRVNFDDDLFFRVRKNMLPTPRALELAPDIEAALKHLRSAVSRPEFQAKTSIAAFRLATTDEMELFLLPGLVKRMEATAPCVSINCRRLQSLYRLPDADLQSGTLDFAIGAFAQTPSVETNLMFHELFEEQFVCIARVGHPYVKRRLSLSQFRKLNHAVTFYPGLGPGLVDRILAERGYKRQDTISLPHFLSVPFVVARSNLIATGPEVVARKMSASLPLQVLKCPLTVPRLPISLVWHSRTQESSSHKWFRDLVIHACHEAMRRN